MRIKRNLLCLFVVLCGIVLGASSFANDGEVCDVPTQTTRGQQGQSNYDVSVNNPIRISSQEAGFQSTGCGAATFGAAGTRSAPNDAHGRPATQNDIVNACARAGGLSATNAGTFDQYMAGLVAILNQDMANCYQITIKRIINYTAVPVLTLPAPQTTLQRNVRILTYRPYNFQVADIVDAMQRVSPIAGGIGMGGVMYNAQNEDAAAHMFQPLAINSVGRMVNNQREHDFKIYDPYFARDADIKIMFDNDRRIYANIWSKDGNDLWFHLEELFFTENLGPCPSNWTWNSTGGGGKGHSSRPIKVKGPITGQTVSQPVAAPIRGPTTPTGCGTRDLVNNACVITVGCVNPNEYCSFATFCTCKAIACGDNVKDPGEQCDDGNNNNNDGCSAHCETEEICPGNNQWMLASQIECETPNTACFRISHGSLARGVCSNHCACEPLSAPAPEE